MCAVSFGVLSPVSMGGFVLGASLIHAGIAIAAGMFGASLIAGGSFKIFDKKPMRKHLEELGDKIKSPKDSR